MELEERQDGQLLVLAGRLDLPAAADLREALHRALDRGTGDLVLDVGRLEIRDSSGLGVLLGAHRRASRAGRRVVLHDVPPPVRRMLRITRLHRVLHVTPLACERPVGTR
jgi:anti-anti-sigma factor